MLWSSFHSKPIASVFKLKLQSCTTQWYFMWPHPSITSVSGLILIFSSCPRLKVHLNSNKLHSWNMRICLLLLGLHGQDYYFVLKPISDVFNPLQGWRLCSSLNTCLNYVDSNHKLVKAIYHSLCTVRFGNRTAKTSMRAGLPSSENRLFAQKQNERRAVTERGTEQYWVAETALLKV